MVLPYWEELHGNQVRLYPIIPVTLSHGSHSIDSLALIDSGAEHSVFPWEIAEELDFDLFNQNDTTIVGVGGTHSPGKAAVIDYQLGKHKWTGPIIFSTGVNDRPLLGQAGFFAFFTVTFRLTKREVEIKRSRSPRVQGWSV